MNTLLSRATKLQSFFAYKLRGPDKLTFASNALESLCIRRSDLLKHMSIYAPNLKELSVQACFDLSSIRFLARHKLRSELPANHQPPRRLAVDAENAVLGKAALNALLSHPRVSAADKARLREEDCQDFFAF
eukprot:4000640-Amphidinium_carterae.1